MKTQIMNCCICNNPILSNNENPRMVEYERKWRIHWECREIIEQKLDDSTGMAAERKGLWKKAKQ